MTERHKHILFFILCAGILQLLVLLNFEGYLYLSDSAQSFVMQTWRKVVPPRHGFTVVPPEGARRYKAVYEKMPPGLAHCGLMLFYEAPRDISIAALAGFSLRYTRYYKSYQLEKDIRKYNGLKNGRSIKKGDVIYIPHPLPALAYDLARDSLPVPVFSRGLYYTGSTAGRSSFFEMLDPYIRQGVNTVVFDAKDITGIINYHSHVPAVVDLNTHGKRTIDDLEKFIRELRKRNIYIIARVAVFHDHLLHRKRPDLAIQSASTGKPWRGPGQELWCDPTSRAVQDYNLSIAVELAEHGVDEIQFDYIRFPTGGNQGDARFAYNFGKMSTADTITGFLRRAHGEISRRNTLLSIDIFGVVAWGKAADIRNTGQDIKMLSKYCDVISPMLYPSHFNDDFDGHAKPGDQPYYFIYTGCAKVRSLAEGTLVRPWLQAFRWRTSSYDADYILQQIRGAYDAGAKGYLFWNASNNYDTVYRALSEMNRKHESAGKNAAKRMEQ
ncbi:MAG TPA: hypothetical protein ENN21_07410 [Spirochaetes bacterium]|nr:hypothetical protein [Spirochaetota bacterium]